MVAEARALLPIDLLALVAHGSTVSYENEAWPRERLGGQETQPMLSVLRDQVKAFGRRRSTWVCARRQKLMALVGTRPRGGRQAREIDYLVDNGAGTAVVSKLLTQAVSAAGSEGAEKLFLRLAAGSRHLQAAHETGFMAYQEESLLVHRGELSGDAAACRPVTAADSYPLFRLYTAATPEPLRRHEAATYAEWQAGLERRWLRNGVHLAVERDGTLAAAVKASRLSQGDLFELTLGPDADVGAVSLIVAAAGRLTGPQTGPTFTLVPLANERITRQLEDAGFEVAGEFVSLVHRTTRPLALPKALPAVAENAVGV
jgi:hypothetical protein